MPFCYDINEGKKNPQPSGDCYWRTCFSHFVLLKVAVSKDLSKTRMVSGMTPYLKEISQQNCPSPSDSVFQESVYRTVHRGASTDEGCS